MAKQHSKGIHFKPSITGQGHNRQVFLGVEYEMPFKDAAPQARADAEYLNRLVQEDEARQAAFQKLQKTDEDLLVNLGNLGNARLEQVELNAEYEAMVQDYLDTFNHAVTQGVAPIRAIYAMCQGFGITLGCALRADLPFDVAKALVQMITTTASAQEKMLRMITQSMPSN